MANKGTEAKSLVQKDAERAEQVMTEAKKREWRKWIKSEIEDLELNIKYYSYQLQLDEIYARWTEWQKNVEKSMTELQDSKDGTEVVPEEETKTE